MFMTEGVGTTRI